MTGCDVIIVNYNTGPLLSDCVNGVLKSLQDVNVWVVDNASIDGSMGTLVEDSRLTKIYRKDNYGFAKSCNHAAQLGHSEYLLILNPDCIIGPDTISQMITELQKNPSMAMLGCDIRNPDGSEQRASRRRLPTFWRTVMTVTHMEKLAGFLPFFTGINLSHKPRPEALLMVEATSGALMLVRRKAFEKLHGFDEEFPMHFEDLDLMKRLQDLGYQIGFDPNVSVVHHQGTSSKSNPKVEKMKRQGLIRYFKKHGSSMSYRIIKWLLKV